MSSLPLFYDRVLETSTTTGTGTLTLAGAVAGYQTWGILGNSNSAFYYIEAVDANGVPTGDWEVGLGTYTTIGTTLARSVITSSNANALVNFGAGTKRVALTNPATYVQQTTRAVPQLRITTETGVPVSTTDRTAQATLFATPSTPSGAHLNTGYVRTYTGSRVREQSISADKSLGLAIVSGAVQDIFIKDSDLSLTAEYWRNATITVTLATPAVVTWTTHGLTNGDLIVFSTTGALPTGMTAGTTYSVLVLGANTFNIVEAYTAILVNTSGSQSGTHTGYVVGVPTGNTTQPRTNALATPTGTDLITSGADNTFLWLGTIRADGTNTTADSQGGTTTKVGGFRGVWNAYNQVPRPLAVFDSTDSWSYTTNQTRNADGDSGNRVSYVTGHANTRVTAQLLSSVEVGGNAATEASVGIGIDAVGYVARSQTPISYNQLAAVTIQVVNAPSFYKGYPGIGAHGLLWLETGAGGTCTFFGDNGDISQSGMTAEILA